MEDTLGLIRATDAAWPAFLAQVDSAARALETRRRQLRTLRPTFAAYAKTKFQRQKAVERAEEHLGALKRKEDETNYNYAKLGQLKQIECRFQSELGLLKKHEGKPANFNILTNIPKSQIQIRLLREELKMSPYRNPKAGPTWTASGAQIVQAPLNPSPSSESDGDVEILETPPPQKIVVLNLSPDRPSVPTSVRAVDADAALRSTSPPTAASGESDDTAERLAELKRARRGFEAKVFEATETLSRRRQRLARADEEKKDRRLASVGRAEEALADLKREAVESLQLNLERLLRLPMGGPEHSKVTLKLAKYIDKSKRRLRGLRADLQQQPSPMADSEGGRLSSVPRDAAPPTPPPTPDNDVQVLVTPAQKTRLRSPDPRSSPTHGDATTATTADASLPTPPLPPTGTDADTPPAVLTMLPGLPFPVLILPPNYGDWARAFASAQPTPPTVSGVHDKGAHVQGPSSSGADQRPSKEIVFYGSHRQAGP